MSFAGKYQLESHENFEPFMRAIGFSQEIIEKGKDIKSISEIEENGDSFKVTLTTGSKVLTNMFVIGQESDVETFTGKKVKVVVRREGNKLLTITKGAESVTEMVDANTMVDSITLGGITYKRILKRI